MKNILFEINNIAENLGLYLDENILDVINEKKINIKRVNVKKDSDSTLLIGDNFFPLIDLALSSNFSVDFCYIDPPYNTGGNFIYNDNRKSSVSQIYGSHGAWMAFMLPRLFLARMVMKSDGIIAISIDDYEFAYLKILMDRIFGEKNFIGNIIVCRSKNGRGSSNNIASTHEYLLVYGKTLKAKLIGSIDDVNEYDKSDMHGKYKIDGLFRKKGADSLKDDRPNMYYPLYANLSTGNVYVEPDKGLIEIYPVDSKGIKRRWLWGKETTSQRSWQLYSSKNGVIYVKNYFSSDKRKKIRSLWDYSDYYTEKATNEITELFGEKIFDTPKSLKYIMSILDTMTKSDALILDFFAGSGTIAHAAAMLNSIDNGTRKTILMENDVLIPNSHISYKHGYKYISDITIARLKKIKEQYINFNYRIEKY
ncbi:site-specific DNA-methyltransferase [Proteus genomosp. 6]|uniref:site-specific DNA-methyltransferase (adenine-specific) n=1 Tax=Proteus genomosp. 6 TaxID=1311820 RepID=A0ABV1LCF0_9GAMM